MQEHGPDFLILGAMKCGTTSLSLYLKMHPSILWPNKKELHYYSQLRTKTWTLEDYVKQFPETPSGTITGEATPVYLRLPEAPAQVAADFPGMKFLVILRNPVERAFSHYIQRSGRGRESRRFEEVIKIEEQFYRDGRCPDLYLDQISELSYLARGLYAEQIKNWQRHFPIDRFHVLFTDELMRDYQLEMDKVFNHLGLSRIEIVREVHAHSREYGPMPVAVRSRLERFFEAPDQELEALLGRQLPWKNGRLQSSSR
jgi:hypothetical protein